MNETLGLTIQTPLSLRPNWNIIPWNPRSSGVLGS